jgi:uncharacterized integral membrane protein
VAQEQETAKAAGAKERATGLAQRLATARTFVVILIVLLAVILVGQNLAPVPVSVFGVMFHVPGILWYVLLFACGALVGIWLEGRRRAE